MPVVARDIMNPKVLCAQENWNISELATFLIEHMITGAPVVDGEGNVLGVVSVYDIARRAPNSTDMRGVQGKSDYYVNGFEDRLHSEEMPDFRVGGEVGERVKDIMTQVIHSVEEDCPVFEMAEMMIRNRIHRLLVTRGKLLVGIVTTLDLLKILTQPG